MIQHADGIESIYCHLSRFTLVPFDSVSAAISGSTGKVTGPHLHFAIKKMENLLTPNHCWLQFPDTTECMKVEISSLALVTFKLHVV